MVVTSKALTLGKASTASKADKECMEAVMGDRSRSAIDPHPPTKPHNRKSIGRNCAHQLS